jgi:hypothetical protein
MQIKRLLDDGEVFVGSKVIDAQGRSYAFVELYELEMLGRDLELIRSGMVGRKSSN